MAVAGKPEVRNGDSAGTTHVPEGAGEVGPLVSEGTAIRSRRPVRSNRHLIRMRRDEATRQRMVRVPPALDRPPHRDAPSRACARGGLVIEL